MKKKLKSLSMLKDNSGAALMMAVFTMTMLMAISMDMLFETSVELQVSSQAINQVKAYYAAKSGVEISLLRIHIYRKASAMLGAALPSPSMLDPIWQFPFTWPPVLPEDTSAVDKDEVKDAVKASYMQGQYLATIESEGSKIDINDLASPSKAVADATKQQILQIFTSQVEADENFATRFRGFEFERLVNNMADWVDDNRESLNGGDESTIYQQRENVPEEIPPNAPFKTVQELHLVEGMTDELFDLLQPRITVFGVKGININYADKKVLMSLTPEINEERADKIIEGRNDPNRGPFKDEKDFVSFVNSLGVNGNPFREGNDVKIPLIFDAEHNFRIRSQGISGKVTKDITAIVYDFDRVRERLKTLVTPPKNPDDPKKPDDATTPPDKPADKPGNSAPAKVPNERPNIVYWNEA